MVKAYIRIAINVTLNKEAFVKSLYNDTKNDNNIQKDIDRYKKRENELKALTKMVFEQNALGKIDDETFSELYSGYKTELKEISEKIRVLEDKATEARDSVANARLFAELTAKYTDADVHARNDA